jgi:putative chitinase
MIILSAFTRRFKEIARNVSVAKQPDTIKRMNEALNEALQDAPVVRPDKAKSVISETPNTFDTAAFFAVLRNGPLRHKKPSQVMGTEAILGAMAGLPVSWCAYALATAWHETAYTQQPIKERGGRGYFMRMYDKTGNRPGVAKALGNTVAGDGATYAGRGFVQLTGRRNYGFAERKIGEPLLSNPDLAMRPDIAARILREGMIDGWFTGRGFVAFLPSDGPASLTQFRQARRIINGMDKADKIAGEALAFQAALIGGGWA